MVYFTLLLLATRFGSIYLSHLQAKVLFTQEGDIYNRQYCCPLRDVGLTTRRWCVTCKLQTPAKDTSTSM